MDQTDRIVLRVDTADPLTAMGTTEALRPFADLIVTRAPDNGVSADVVLVFADVVDGATLARIRAAQGVAGRPVVLVASTLDESSAFAAVEAGARAILWRREARPERIADVVHSSMRGEGTLPVDVLGRLLDRLGEVRPDAGARVGRLTERETEVLRLVSEGLETAEIAERLHYSQRTIKGVLHDLSIRHQLRNRAHAVAYAMRQGLI